MKNGCAHVLVACAHLDRFILTFHKRVLFDHSGYWYAANDTERAALAAYCDALHAMPDDDRHTFLCRMPSSALTVERALSEPRRQRRA